MSAMKISSAVAILAILTLWSNPPVVTAAQGLPPVAADEEVVVSPIVPTPDTPAPASASPFAKQPVVAPAPMAPAGGGKLPAGVRSVQAGHQRGAAPDRAPEALGRPGHRQGRQ